MLVGLPATFLTPGITGRRYFLPRRLRRHVFPAFRHGQSVCLLPEWRHLQGPTFPCRFCHPDNTTFSLVLPSPSAQDLQRSVAEPSLCAAVGTRSAWRHRSSLNVPAGLSQVRGRPRSGRSNYTVSASGVAGVRRFEMRVVTTAPTTFQESTYPPPPPSAGWVVLRWISWVTLPSV